MRILYCYPTFLWRLIYGRTNDVCVMEVILIYVIMIIMIYEAEMMYVMIIDLVFKLFRFYYALLFWSAHAITAELRLNTSASKSKYLSVCLCFRPLKDPWEQP